MNKNINGKIRNINVPFFPSLSDAIAFIKFAEKHFKTFTI